MRSTSMSTGWLHAALVLAFCGAVASVGSMGVVHDLLHRTAILDWQRLQRAELLHSHHIGQQVAAHRLVHLESGPPQ